MVSFLFFCCIVVNYFATAIYSHHPSINIQNGKDIVTSQLHYNIHSPFQETFSVPSYGINVLDYGAKGDATTDNTVYFQNALNAAVSKDQGGYVYVPSGQYLFSGSITIPFGITLIGTYMFPPEHKPKDKTKGIQWSDLTDGSILGSHKNLNSSFIIMQSSSTIKGFSIFYPDQLCAQKSNKPIEYPATVLVTAPNVGILDLELINSYIGVSASIHADRHYVARVMGGPIHIGVFIDNVHDIGRVENVHFKSDWSCPYNVTVTHHAAMFGRAFVIGDSDWQFIFNTFAIGYAGGYNFISTSGDTNACNGNFLGISADACTNYSIKVDQTQPFGIAITNGEFVARGDARNIKNGNTPTHVIVSDGNIGGVSFSNCAFWGDSTTYAVARIYSDSSVSFENCEIHRWNTSIPAILSNNGIIRIIGNNFYDENAILRFEKGTQKAIVIGNTFKGKPNIYNGSGVELAVTANL